MPKNTLIDMNPLYDFVKKSKFKQQPVFGTVFPDLFVREFKYGMGSIIFRKFKNGKFKQAVAIYRAYCFANQSIPTFAVSYQFGNPTSKPDEQFVKNAIKFFRALDNRFNVYLVEFNSLAETVTTELTRKTKE